MKEQFNKMQYPQYIIDQFWSKIKSPEKDDDCWLWTAYKDRDGYGKFRGKGAHRFSWEFFYGQISDNMSISHTCDNPSCCNPHHLIQTLSKHPQGVFWNNINYPGNDYDCWEWTAQFDKDGYGKYRSRGVHRIVWEFYNGQIPLGKCVLHKCDNRKCCNPNHLFLGTIQENTADRHKKGRSAKGSKIGTSVLTEDIVCEILNKILSNEFKSISQVATAYNVSYNCISTILDGIRWKHITNKYPIKEIKSKLVNCL